MARGLTVIWRHATAGVAASDSAGEALFGERWRSDARFRIIHNGIDLSRFSSPADPREPRRALGFPEDAPVVGHGPLGRVAVEVEGQGFGRVQVAALGVCAGQVGEDQALADYIGRTPPPHLNSLAEDLNGLVPVLAW